MIRNIKDYILGQRRNNFLCLICVISLIKCLVLFLGIEVFLTPERQIGYFPDSAMYETLADNLLLGHGFSSSTFPPFRPTMWKEPLYPFFIALIKFLFGSNINFVIFIQMFLNTLIAVLIYFIGKEIFSERIARLSAFIVALIPVYGEISFFVASESIFIVLLSAAILCLIKAVKSMNWIWFILSGLLLGLSSLCKNAVVPLFLLYPTAILFKKRKDIKRGLVLKLITFILCFSVVTIPWMIRNQVKFGLFSISRRGGEILSHQAAWAANFSRQEWRAYTLYLLSGNLAQKLYPQIIGDNFGDYEYAVLMRMPYVEELLKRHGEGEAEKILTLEAINNIIRHPLRYLLLSAIIYVQTFKYFESATLMLIRSPAGLEWIMSLVRFFVFIMGIAYTLFALRGILYSRRLFESYLILVTIVYFHIAHTCVGIIPGAMQRYILPITIFYSFFVVIAIDQGRCARS